MCPGTSSHLSLEGKPPRPQTSSHTGPARGRPCLPHGRSREPLCRPWRTGCSQETPTPRRLPVPAPKAQAPPPIHVLAMSEPDLLGRSRGHGRGRTAACPPRGPTDSHCHPLSAHRRVTRAQWQPARFLLPQPGPRRPHPTHPNPLREPFKIRLTRTFQDKGRGPREGVSRPGESTGQPCGHEGRGGATVLPLTPLRVSQRTAELLTLRAR